MKLKDGTELVELATTPTYVYSDDVGRIIVSKCTDGAVPTSDDNDCDAAPDEVTDTLVLVITAHPVTSVTLEVDIDVTILNPCVDGYGPNGNNR
jgi:hypothetical protein